MRKPFIAAVLAPLIIDHLVTVAGQPAAYWADFSFANEGSPAKFLLEQHPALFLLWGAVYAILAAILLFRLPQRFALPLGLLIYTGHAWGSASWIPRLLPAGFSFDSWYATIAYFAILSILLAWGMRSWTKKAP